LKEAKARGPDEIVAEQIKWGGTKLWEWVIKLIKGVIHHGVVLDNTLESWVKPIVKDKKGSVEDSNHYSGILVISVWAKLIDSLILKKINDIYETSENQFGFKKRLSTKMAVQAMVEIGNIYCRKGGSLFCGFVDVSKAFDKLDYEKIWEKMENIKVGDNLIRMLKEQYKKQINKVVWEGEESRVFKVGVGVRQGSPLSPILFAMVLDDVVDKIRGLDSGCTIKGKTINILVFADDIVILGPTRHAICKIFAVLSKELQERGLEVNKGKTVAMEINRNVRRREWKEVLIEGEKIEWVREYKFLGVLLQANFEWEKQMRRVGTKMNKLGNMILKQVGNIVQKDDRCFLLETCAFDLYGVEFCEKVGKKIYKDTGKSYH
jgi:hypothetical protein